MQSLIFPHFSSTVIQNKKIQTNYSNNTDIIIMNSECKEIIQWPSHDKIMQKYITIFRRAA